MKPVMVAATVTVAATVAGKRVAKRREAVARAMSHQRVEEASVEAFR